jgi:hypothetical protein
MMKWARNLECMSGKSNNKKIGRIETTEKTWVCMGITWLRTGISGGVL